MSKYKINRLNFYKIKNRIDLIFSKIKFFLFYQFIFGYAGRSVAIYKPLLIVNAHRIFIGNLVVIRQGVRLEVVITNDHSSPKLTIGNNVNIEQNVHIVCGCNVSIADNVSIAAGAAIVDVNHPHTDVLDSGKIADRIDVENNYVEIGEGVLIGYGAIILPNVRIGRRAVVGAHAVVTKDVPEYSTVAGNPARLIKKYSFERNQWERH
ncbi:acyltransferase [Janthinobacterium lividum]|uniref:acyltransferase n=1 Tax=Janthinobacterium lividum TaxID=29581 RepID=UPI001595B6E4|nr:acyltransferase [Janthinobacterium lividum]QKY05603.1 acyltransferase [Janthinobacterium lividum]